MQQGLKAVQNSAAKRGLGVSGAAQKGAASFVSGLADQTYKTQFDVENTNRKNAYDRLMGLVAVGQSSAAQTSTAGTAAAKMQGDAAIGAGNANAAAWNAIGTAGAKTADGLFSGANQVYKGLYSAPTQGA